MQFNQTVLNLISFPALLFADVPPITANATNNTALLMGTFGSVSAYRKELLTQRHEVFILSGISLIGGILGSLLLLHTPQKLFAKLIPYLLFVASLLFAFSKTLIKWLRSHSDELSRTSYFSRGVILLVQLAIATYGGFFGGGIGILLLATLSLLLRKYLQTARLQNLDGYCHQFCCSGSLHLC